MLGVIGTGQVAQHVTAALRTRMLPHVVFTRSSSRVEGGALLYSEDSLPEQFDVHGITTVINCAALRDIAVCEKDLEAAWNANVHLPKMISKLVKQIYISTDYVFDRNEEGRLLDESAESRGAMSAYGQSKLEGERAVLALGGVVARISSPFGKYPSPMKPHFVDFAARSINVLELPTDQKFRLSYLPDVADILIDLAYKDQATGVYHVVNEGTANWHEVAILARKMNRNKAKVKGIIRNDTTRPANGALLNTRLPKLRHWFDAMDEYFRGPLAEESITR
jgi:dTDP-4-dehydrorhamnose reductase